MGGRGTSETDQPAPQSKTQGKTAERGPLDGESQAALATLTDFRAAHSLDALWDTLQTFAKAMGIDVLTYHHHAPSVAGGLPNVSVRATGFPDGWIEKYSTAKLHRTDPILNVFAGRLRPLRWSEVEKVIPLKPNQMEYLTSLQSWLKGDGVGFPVFGPSGRHAYIGYGSTNDPLAHWDDVTMHRVHWVSQSFHLRYCELVLLEMPKDFALDKRELLVLESMSQGVSDEIICGIVGASLDSVQRSVRSIQKKMSVSDRASAILRGIGAGLIDRDVAIANAH